MDFLKRNVCGSALKSNLFILVLFCLMPNSLMAGSNPCVFKEYSVTVDDSARGFGTSLDELNIKAEEKNKIASEFQKRNDEAIENLDEVNATAVNVMRSNNESVIRILSVQVGSSWDHLEFVFKKIGKHWAFLKALPITRIDDQNAVKYAEYKNHKFLLLMDVSSHGCCPWFSNANWDVFLVDGGMREAGQFIANGGNESYVSGSVAYETERLMSSQELGCPLELDLKVDVDAYWDSVASHFHEKYQFEEFKAFIKTLRIFYLWDEKEGKFVFDSKRSDYKYNPLKTKLDGLNENQFLNLFNVELKSIAQQKNANKNIWLKSIIDNITPGDVEAVKNKKEILRMMK